MMTIEREEKKKLRRECRGEKKRTMKRTNNHDQMAQIKNEVSCYGNNRSLLHIL